jgi:hypothetical protein
MQTIADDIVDEVTDGCHHVGRYAEGYAFAFKRGAVDALRVAARRLPSSTWDALTQLSDEYTNVLH